MRCNIYAEEITTEATLVRKDVEETGLRFYGLRLYLKSPDDLHHSEIDDDRSAITLFVPWTRETGHQFHIVEEALDHLKSALALARSEEYAADNARYFAEKEAERDA